MSNASSKGVMVLGLGVAAVGVAAAMQAGAKPSTGSASTAKPSTGSTTKPSTGGTSTTTPSTGSTMKPVTGREPPAGIGLGYITGVFAGLQQLTGGSPAPTTTPAATAAPTTGNVPAGPAWTGEPAVNASTLLDKRTDALSAFLLKVQPLYWSTRPKERRIFASELVTAAYQENYPLDMLVGHCWAEGALRPYMTPTAGSGAYGPLQVTAIACQDVGMSYPPRTVQQAVTVGIRLLRLYAKRHAEASGSFNNALRIYGMGYGGFLQFQQAGCSGKPCERAQSVWRHECGCSGAGNRYTWKVNEMARKASAANLHTLPWSNWRAK